MSEESSSVNELDVRGKRLRRDSDDGEDDVDDVDEALGGGKGAGDALQRKQLALKEKRKKANKKKSKKKADFDHSRTVFAGVCVDVSVCEEIASHIQLSFFFFERENSIHGGGRGY